MHSLSSHPIGLVSHRFSGKLFYSLLQFIACMPRPCPSFLPVNHHHPSLHTVVILKVKRCFSDKVTVPSLVNSMVHIGSTCLHRCQRVLKSLYGNYHTLIHFYKTNLEGWFTGSTHSRKLTRKSAKLLTRVLERLAIASKICIHLTLTYCCQVSPWHW